MTATGVGPGAGATLFTGRIWCPTQGDLHALVVADGAVIATDEAAHAWAADHPGVARVEITDGLLMPAFGDGHAHPQFGGLEAEGPQVRRQTTVDGIVAEVRRWAEAHPDEPWVRGASYDSSLVPEGLFDARWLDEAVADRPVMLRAWDYHTLWVNTKALELAGITSATSDPPLGEIPHRPDGSVLGTLREWGAIDLVADLAGPHDLDTRVRAIERACAAYAALGVTWVQDAWVGPTELEAYLEAARRDALPIQFNLALYADPRHWPASLDRFLEQRAAVGALAHPQLTAHTVKFFADGVVENETAAVLAPYDVPEDARGNHDRHPHDGMLVWPPELLAEAVTAVDAAGFQPHIHAIGDRAVRVALDALEQAAATNGPRDRRPVIAHVQLIDEVDRDRLAALGVVVNAEPLWAQTDALMEVLTVPRLGEERSAQQYPWATLLGRRAALSFGSDWPVSSADPLEGLAVACSRQTADREPRDGWTPHERLPLTVALRAYTAGSAHQAFRRAGTLEPGGEADLVELDRDAFGLTDLRDLDAVRVRRTWRLGRQIHPAVDDASSARTPGEIT